MDAEIPWTKSEPLPAKYRKPRKKQKDSRPSAKYRPTDPKKKLKADRMAALEASKPFLVTLRRGHNVNGAVYGPGSVKLPGPLARELSAREYHADQQEEIFRGERAAIIGGQTAQGTHRVKFVPVETFTESYGAAMPVERISGKGLSDPGTAAGNAQF